MPVVPAADTENVKKPEEASDKKPEDASDKKPDDKKEVKVVVLYTVA